MRGVIAVAAAALCLSLALVATAAAAAPAPREGCEWQQRTKHVVKQVKRHDKLRREKTAKHWWTCVPTQAAPTATPPAPALVVPPPPPVEEAPAVPTRLGVKSVEYAYTLSRPEVSSGEVTIELNNLGEDPHNLKIEREDSDEPAVEIPSTASLQRTTAHFDLPPGTYRLYCSLYFHDAAGMHAQLVVGEAAQ